MSAHGDQIKSVLGISALVSFYGIASLAVVFLGPSIGLTYVWEIVTIALLLLTWPFAILINHWRKRPAAKREPKPFSDRVLPRWLKVSTLIALGLLVLVYGLLLLLLRDEVRSAMEQLVH